MVSLPPDVNLDPDDWKKTQELGYEIIDLMVNYHKEIRDQPVWKEIPTKIKEYFTKDIPNDGISQKEVLEEFKEYILPYPTGNIHPRFWGWVHGTGTTFGALAELLAATMNPNTGGREHVANYVDQQIIKWAKQMLDYDQNASGMITSGCSMANLTCLTVARNVKSPIDIRKEGLQNLDKTMTIYGSTEMHSSIQKAVEVLGIGSNFLQKIPVNPDYTINIEALKTQIEEDKANGFQPICIVGNAGTVNSGAFDNFEAIANIAEDENLWFHIDGAFGALAVMLSEYDEQTSGFHKADSVAFDMHKWMYMPYEIGCALVKHPKEHRSAFSLRPDYLSQMQRGLASFDKWPTEYGVELSRSFRALKAWMSIKEHGIEKYKKVILKNIKQARYLGNLIEEHDRLELLTPVSLNIVCFRYTRSNLSEEAMEKINKELLLRIQESGIAVFSSTTLSGTYSLRVANTNQRSKSEDFDILVKHVVQHGNQIYDENNY